ncbi:universal stress protein [Siminovitchia sediminis]|uniref:Universal stress protein n=1 Tax=Siminovitchia sediminis TaxID=1274353 RepID=A0ABW4KDZ3_9BACI
MSNRMLLAIDGSEHSLRAAKEAIKLALLTRSIVDIVLVADFAKTKSEVLHTKNREDLAMIRRKRLRPAEELLEAKGISYQTHILHGDPGPAIVEFANQGDFDMVVIGSRGLNKLQEMVLGSVSHKVMKRVNCPVLIVK